MLLDNNMCRKYHAFYLNEREVVLHCLSDEYLFNYYTHSSPETLFYVCVPLHMYVSNLSYSYMSTYLHYLYVYL